jgi:hypothetical protein
MIAAAHSVFDEARDHIKAIKKAVEPLGACQVRRIAELFESGAREGGKTVANCCRQILTREAFARPGTGNEDEERLPKCDPSDPALPWPNWQEDLVSIPHQPNLD